MDNTMLDFLEKAKLFEKEATDAREQGLYELAFMKLDAARRLREKAEKTTNTEVVQRAHENNQSGIHC